MANVINVTPDKDGRVFITLYGTKYEIVVNKPEPSEDEE
jgi:hypothetical protein